MRRMAARVCAFDIARRAGAQAPRSNDRASVTKATFSEDLLAYGYINLNYFFHGFSELAAAKSMNGLPRVREMRYAFANCGLTELGLCGSEASQLEDLFYCFASSVLVTIWAGAGRAGTTP